MEANNPFSWQDQGECVGKDPQIFFQDERDGSYSREAYKAICAVCPVQAECLNTAILYNFDGVWGGTTDVERRHRYDREYREQLIEELEEIGEFVPLDKIAA